jgi:uncharacterized protein YfaS (alpha-2-macroglobulin family)
MLLKRALFCITATFFLFTATAQKMNSYDKQWKKVDSLLNKKGLTESALTEVNNIYELAKKEKNDAQVIKALLYHGQLRSIKEEEPLKKNIAELEGEIKGSTEPVRSLLQNLTASLYWTYFQQNRWRLYNRTNTAASFSKEDMATWTADDLHQKISELFVASLKNEKLLKQTALEPFDPLITKGNMRYLRPTLFDLLAHRALDYFKTDEKYISKPIAVFEIDDLAAFAPANSFATHRFKIADSSSLHAIALQLFQRLLQFHQSDAKPDALIDADIERLAFVNSYAIMDNKKELYRKALEQVTTQYGNLPIAAQAWYLLADTYSREAGTYNPLQDTTYRYSYLKAKEICEKVIQQKDSSEGKMNCINLLNDIQRKSVNLTTEKVNVPGQAFRVLVTYRNITQLHLRVVKMDKATRDKLSTNTWEDEYWKQLTQLPAVTNWAQGLPDTKDHQTHLVEIKAAALPVGEYAFLISADKDFRLGSNVLAIQSFYVSGLSYINKGEHYYVLDRETGAPVARTNVQVLYSAYDNATRKYKEQKGENMMTGKDGYFTLLPSRTNTERQYRLELTTKDDHLAINEQIYNYQYGQYTPPARNGNQGFLFTDRSIYRPGQTVYFKGIVINRREPTDQNAILANYKTTVYLRDPGGQKLDSLKVTTNEYGSYSGKFTLPTNQLNGSFGVSAENTNLASFSVEEYKRPKFYVEVTKPAGTYKLNDSIKVTGNARAYAGNNIDGAMVNYRVVRKTIMPMWYYGWGRMIWPPVGREDAEIAHGSVTTQSDGSFTITFKAVPDVGVDKKDQPTFQYEVTTDVTDINGETRSGTTTIAVAYQALRLAIDAPEKLHTDSIKNIRVTSTNFNDLFEQAKVTLTMYKLKAPERIYRTRLWNQADQFVMTQQEYYAAFPHDIYKDENEVRTWTRQEKVLEVTDTTTASGLFKTGKNQLPAGWYVIEVATTDKYGEPVKALQYVRLYNQQGEVNPVAYGSIETEKNLYEPGATARYRLVTNLDSVHVIHNVGRKNTKEERKFTILNRNSQSFELPVSENDRGGMGVQIAFVKYNRVYTDDAVFVIPYTNKELTISYTSFRDKTLPGSAEKWKVKISGYKGDQVAAEMLTAMYDASLDQFQPHSWQQPDLWSHYILPVNWTGTYAFNTVQSQERYNNDNTNVWFNKQYDQLLPGGGIPGGGQQIRIRGMALNENAVARFSLTAQAPVMDQSAPKARMIQVPDLKADPDGSKGIMKDQLTLSDGEAIAADKQGQPTAPLQVRKNFNETAFFFPDLKTDSAGSIEFSFTIPEALTKWKWMSLAYTKELAFGYSEKEIITQKELMVQPNAPRFMREGDRMDFSGKIVNLGAKEITGQVQLELIDPTTNQSVDGWFRNVFPNQFFTVAAGQSVPVSFSLEIPYQYNKPLTYRLVASTKAQDGQAALSDGEENMLAVVSNRMLVTESLPLPVRGTGTKSFTFTKLLQSGNSETLNQHALTVEFTSNPAWYAVQALPYLMEYPYECAEQVFNRYYANALATTIANASPRIKAIFERWKTSDTAALLSNLQKNEELKSVLLQETPWVLQAKSESQQKKNIALLFDMVRMSKELEGTLDKLQDMQTENGGFVWFKGGRDDRYITQYILTSIGHLKRLKALPNDKRLTEIVKAAIPYLDKALKEDYDYLVKHKVKLTDNNLSYTQIQYLYMRSFFAEYPVPGDVFKAYNYYHKQSQQFWLKQNKYMQGMIALSLQRTGDNKTSFDIVRSLKQNALVSEEMGMYWKELTSGYYWYQSPIEAQALLIEAFTEVTKDSKAVADMKTWLLKQKQTQDWKTTKATAEACYALLLQGTDWLTNTPEVQISLGNYTIRSSEQQQEAGTGYFKKVIDGTAVKPEMGNIKVAVSSTSATAQENVSWGAVYWQYFENLDKITTAATPLKLDKKLFVEKNTDRGPILEPVKEGDALHVGDKIKVRIELRVDRNMEYVHMKDMRAACMEPVNVLSSYKWQGGLGYYESTKDASTNFFFGSLPKGTWVFEYPLFVTHTGTFSNGVTTIQCMYAPEFTSHSEGIKVNVEAK